MNRYELLQFGEMIQKTAARHGMTKLAQAPLHSLIGALGGGAAGYRAYDAFQPNGDQGSTWGRLAATLAGAGLGGAIGAGAPTPNARFASGQFMHNLAQGTERMAPWAGAALGGLTGYNSQRMLSGALGNDIAGDPNNPKDSWNTSTRLLAAALGAGMGASGFSALNNMARTRGLSQMRRAITDAHGEDAASDIMTALRNSGHGGAMDVARYDPNRMVASTLAAEGAGRLSANDMMAAWGNPNAVRQTLFNRAMPQYVNAAGANAVDYDAISQLAQQLGVSMPSTMNPVSRQLASMLGPNYMQDYVRPAAMLGGAYVGANMLGNVYNRFTGNNQQQQQRRQVVIV